jgi:hypothetical protein
MPNITHMLESRRASGKRLSAYRHVLPNREAANVMHNRTVRDELVKARGAKRHANELVRIAGEARERVFNRFLEGGYNQQMVQEANTVVARAEGMREEARRNYDRVVDDVSTVMKKHEKWRQHYHKHNDYHGVGQAAIQKIRAASN